MPKKSSFSAEHFPARESRIPADIVPQPGVDGCLATGGYSGELGETTFMLPVLRIFHQKRVVAANHEYHPNRRKRVTRMKMNRLLFIALAAWAMNAQASFNGQVILAEYLFPNDSTVLPGEITPAQATVGAAVEFSSNGIGIDFSSNNILWTNIEPTGASVTFAPGSAPESFNGHRFRDVNGTIPAITGVTINAATTLAGFDASRVFFDANSIRVNFESLVVFPDDIVSLDVTFAAEPAPAPQAVPTISALGLGLLGLLLGLIGIYANRSRARS